MSVEEEKSNTFGLWLIAIFVGGFLAMFPLHSFGLSGAATLSFVVSFLALVVFWLTDNGYGHGDGGSFGGGDGGGGCD